MSKTITIIIFLLLSVSSILQAKKTEIRFGVFSYLGYEKTKEEYQPLVDYLNTILKEEVVVLEVLPHEKIDYRIANQTLDIITTNPNHYVNVRAKNDVQGVLATRLQASQGNVLSHLGGVIFTRANQKNINTLEDIKKKNILAPSRKHMGGFMAQMYEIKKQANIDESDFKSLNFVGIHQQVVRDILSGKGEVGFVRDGVLEKMVASKEISLDQIKIINLRKYEKFPHIVSTTLYPEWPVFALSHTNQLAIKHFASALYSLESQEISGIYGYVPPADYSIVEDLVRELRLPPHDVIEEIYFDDIWEKYQYIIIFILLSFISFVIFFILNQQKKKFTQLLLESVGDGIYGVNINEKCVFINKAALNILGFKEDEILHKDEHKLFHHHTLDFTSYEKENCPIFKTLHDRKTRVVRENFIKKDGTYFPVDLTVSPTGTSGVIVVFRDITASVQYEKRLETEVQEKTIDLKNANIHLQELLNTDTLTNIASRRFFLEHLERDIHHTNRNKVPLTLISLDIDNFKIVNDTYGHDIGDEVLKFFCRIVSSSLRKSDLFGRVGGEEFCISCYNTKLNGALHLAQKIRESVEKSIFSQNEMVIKITCSIGISEFVLDSSLDNLIKNADIALYKAKETGKNKIELFDSKEINK